MIGALTVQHRRRLNQTSCASMSRTGRTPAAVIGDVQVRNRGTIGGSVAHADPAADLPVVRTRLQRQFSPSATGKRTISVDDFFTDYYTTALNADETYEIRVPIPALEPAPQRKLPHPAPVTWSSARRR